MRAIQVGQEQRHAIGLLGHLVIQRRAGQQQDLLRLQCLGDPHLAAVDAVVVALPPGERRDPRGVQSGTGFGDAEADVQITVDDAGQRLGLELVGAVFDHRLHAEDRQVDRAGAVHRRTGPGHLLEQQGRFRDAQTVSAVLLRDRHAQPATRGDGVVELLGEFVRLVLLEPVVIVEPGAQLGHGLADQFLIVAQLETHAARHNHLLGLTTRRTCIPAGVHSIFPCRNAISARDVAQSLLPVNCLALAAKSAKVAPVFSLCDSAWIETS